MAKPEMAEPVLDRPVMKSNLFTILRFAFLLSLIGFTPLTGLYVG